MSRKNPTSVEILITLPWWVSVGLAGVVLFGGAIVQAGLPDGLKAFAPTIAILRMGFSLLLFLIGLKSFIRSFTTKRNLEAQSGIDSIKALHWKEFENLLAEVFRRQGYAVKEQLGGGADGGVDLTLYKDRQKTFVQCKLRTRSAVGVPVARELYGAMAAAGAKAGMLVTTSRYTSEAKAFASGKTIRLIEGNELLRLIQSVQRTPRPAERTESVDESARVCPQCGRPMILRTAKKGARAGNSFWGCSDFPRCRKTLKV